jgi:hypothetical protein
VLTVGDIRLISDISHATTKDIVRLFQSALRDEELINAFNEVLPLVKAALERFVERKEREHRRLHGPPGAN